MINIYTLLLMSASGTLMYFLSCVFGKRTKQPMWQYAMLITAVAMLLIPIQKILEIPKLISVTVPRTVNIGGFYSVREAAQGAAQTASRTPVTVAEIITAIWLIGAVFFAVRIAVKYIKTAKVLKQITNECYSDKVLGVYFKVCDKLSVRRHIIIRESGYLHSPLLFGIIKPMIIIPDRQFSDKELEMILTHELTHYKHRDLWVALAASAAQCVHWFNPAAHFIGKSITDVCELFCDETVVKRLNSADKKAYGSLILSVIEKELNSKLAYTTSMAMGGDGIQKRLRKIVEFKMPTKISVIAGFMAVCACAVSSLTAFGFETAAEVIPEEIKQIIPITAPAAEVVETPVPEAAPAALDEPETSAPADTETPENPPENQIKTSGYDGNTTDDNSAQTESGGYDNAYNETYTDTYGDEPETDYARYNEPQTGTSYVMNADFSENADIESGVFRAESGTKLTISKVTGDALVSVHNAETGEVIYDEREDKAHSSLSMTMPDSGEYYVTAHSEDGGNAGIYIYGE